MGLYLIAATSLSTIMASALIILEVAVALGLVIFVHELGHFAVAKMCGVKCEKFYLGFDIFGLKLAKFRWGETEYGIGALPLGGYVKMLGQDDNPAKAAEEIERARKHREAAVAGDANAEAGATGTDASGEGEFDPRSYLAQSVWKRMAIISAGVVMNVIFAFVVAMVAYGIGVPYTPCEVGNVLPGSPAWRSGLESGDKIVQFGDVENPRFRDLQSGVVLGDLEDGIDLKVRRPDHEGLISLNIVPQRDDGNLAPTIGVTGPAILEVNERMPVAPGSAAAQAEPPFEVGDRILALNGTKLSSYTDLIAYLSDHPEEELTFTVERTVPAGDGQPKQTKEIAIEVPARPIETLGIVMEMGPITAIRKGSPAEQAGLRAGDVLLQVNGEPIGDPMKLPDRLQALAGEEVRLTLQRSKQDEPVEVTIEPIHADWYDWPLALPIDGQPVGVPAIGVAYELKNRIAAVELDSPAAKEGLKTGDKIIAAKILPPKKEKKKESASADKSAPSKVEYQDIDVELGEDQNNWPTLMFALQEIPPGSKVELTLEGGRTVSLTPMPAEDWFNPDRGVNFEALKEVRKATSIGDAAALAAGETVDFLSQVYRLLQKLVENQVSPKVLGGPLTIFDVAGRSASQGLPELLMFIGMLSANLAVINFLPIPLLDGGHMLFLIVEAVRGKPASEKLTIALHYAGFLFILGLMGFVIFLDVGRWDSFGGWLGQ